MACKKIMFHYRKFNYIFHINVFSSNILNNKINCLNTIHNIRPIFINFYPYNNLSTIETVKGTVDVDEFKRLNYCGNKYIAQTLQKMFSITLVEAKIMLRQHPKLKKCSSEHIEKNYKFFRNEGINHEILEKFPNILALEDPEFRMDYLRQLSLDVNKTAPLLTSNVQILRKMVEDAMCERSRIPYGSRIVHISKMLNIPEWEISAKLVQHHYITRLPIERLEKVLKILLKFGVEPKNIMSDFWALRYSPELAERRLQRAINANVHKVKAWMIRCTDEVFERCINRQIENRKILGKDSSVEDYLSKRLECSIENAKYLTEKYPAIVKMNISKMKEMLDYLFDQGYTPGHVCRVPRILVHSLETTKSRITHLKQYGVIPPSLAILCKCKKDFDKYIKKYIKNNKNDSESETKET